MDIDERVTLTKLIEHGIIREEGPDYILSEEFVTRYEDAENGVAKREIIERTLKGMCLGLTSKELFEASILLEVFIDEVNA